MKKGKIVSLHKVNLPKVVCDHLVGKSHTVSHRYTTGVIIMSLGVGLTKVVFLFEGGFIHILGDIVGYAVHGLGAVPFIDGLLNNVKGAEKEEDKNEPFKIGWKDKDGFNCQEIVEAKSLGEAIDKLKVKYPEVSSFSND